MSSRRSTSTSPFRFLAAGLAVASASAVGVAVAGCGGGSPLPATSGTRESGQSRLMDGTFAGKNKCSAKNHERPFVIEWDATDMSSFESKAQSDVVFVKYEGCDLQILDRCSLDALKGANGAYGPVEWTSGSLEKIDVKNEGELYAKLPLGAAALGGRVEAGEQFHMEYFVSGTRRATRDAIYRGDLEKIPGCRGATHFVYAFNLGAFALGSASDVKGGVGATVWGIGAGANKSALNAAEKKGGDLTSCRGETAREVDTCKVPIRLTLRAIDDGANPDVVAAAAPETPTAANLAGKVNAKLEQSSEAMAHWHAAIARHDAGDGKACLRELDAHDKADSDPANISTNPAAYLSMVRSHCVMLAGQCDAGKAQLRRSMAASNQWGSNQIDSIVDMMGGQFCRGGAMSPRDQVIAASATLGKGSGTALDASVCTSSYATLKRLASTVKPRDTDDTVVASAVNLKQMSATAAMCLGRAGDCQGAWRMFGESLYADIGGDVHKTFENLVPQCKGK